MTVFAVDLLYDLVHSYIAASDFPFVAVAGAGDHLYIHSRNRYLLTLPGIFEYCGGPG